MSDLTPVEILILSMLIMAFLQFVPGVFALFSHYTRGQFSKNKASDLATFFIVGAESAATAYFVAIYCVISAMPELAPIIDSSLFAWIVAGILVALGLLFFFTYFKSGRQTTQLTFFPNFTARYREKAKSTKSRSDAFLLGFFSVIPELIFTIPLYILATISVMQLGTTCPERACLTILFALAAISPLIIYHALIATGHNLADFLRFRFKHKQFFRIFITILYFLIALSLILGVLL